MAPRKIAASGWGAEGRSELAFYAATLRALVAQGRLDPAARTLVVGGGTLDRAAVMAAGFTDVVVSNLDSRLQGTEFAPYSWQFRDAEDLGLEDGSFAQVVVHAALHHCASPHRALLEMYRVASRSIVVFESRDSALMRLAERLGLAATFEIEAVFGKTTGGWRNTALPNFIYRWTEREVEKTILSYDPRRKVDARYFYGLLVPTGRLRMHKAKWKRVVAMLAEPLLKGVFALIPKQGNQFAFWIGRSGERFAWLDGENVSKSWYETRLTRVRQPLPLARAWKR